MCGAGTKPPLRASLVYALILEKRPQATLQKGEVTAMRRSRHFLMSPGLCTAGCTSVISTKQTLAQCMMPGGDHGWGS
jgi:hypothetical protein